MRIATVLITLLLAINISSLMANEIDRINSDTCWVGQSSDESVRVANFNTKTNIKFSGYNVRQFTKVVEDEAYRQLGINIKVSSREVYLFCSAENTKIFINSFHNGFGLCTRAIIGPDSIKFDRLSITDNSTGFCNGMEPGKLLGTLIDGNDLETLSAIEDLKEVESVTPSYIGSDFFTIILKQEYILEFDQVKRTIQSFSGINYVQLAQDGDETVGGHVYLDYLREK